VLPLSVRSAKVRKVLVDMHVAPATRRWGTRLLLALAVAVVIGYVPAQILARDPRVPSLRRQVSGLEREIDEVEQKNLRMVREIEALRSDIHTIESRARAELGMVYPNELVLRLSAGLAAGRAAPAQPAQSAALGLAPR
jgi:cell division protein FtsB